jgi:hypothetical protein
MNALCALSFLVLAVDTDLGTGWKEEARDEGITIYARAREGSPVREMKAIGIVDATPREIWDALRDYPNYDKTMPYTEESKVLSSEEGGKIICFQSVVNAPLVDRRDYLIRILDESDWREGKGYLLVSWSAHEDKAIPPRDGVVRVKVNDGFWKLEPRDGGKKTFTTYYIHTDPGGSIPKWIANKANSIAVPNVYKAIRKVVASERRKKPAAP